MSGERRPSLRDETLVRVLERLGDNIIAQESLLGETMKQQRELMAEMDRLERRQHVRQGESLTATEKSQEIISRYRSDMLSLVNEQDRLNEMIKEIDKKQAAVAFSLDNMINTLTDLNNRLEIQEKLMSEVAYSQENSKDTLENLSERLEMQERIVHEINTHSVRHEELLPREIVSLGRSVTKLHADTEKRLGEMHHDTQRQLERLRVETERRLLPLDKMEANMEVLLVRTEPPEKRPNFIVRAARRVRRGFRDFWIGDKGN